MASIKIIGLIVLSLLLSGCASTGAEKWCRQGAITCQYWEYADCERIEGNCRKEWSKETDQSLRDRAECEKVYRSNHSVTWKTKDELKAFELCMKSKGYKKIEKGKIDFGVLHLKMALSPVNLLLSGVLAIPGNTEPKNTILFNR